MKSICKCGRKPATKYSSILELFFNQVNEHNDSGCGYRWLKDHCNNVLGTDYQDSDFLEILYYLRDQGSIDFKSVVVYRPGKGI